MIYLLTGRSYLLVINSAGTANISDSKCCDVSVIHRQIVLARSSYRTNGSVLGVSTVKSGF